MLTRIPKGTKDVLPPESARYQAMEALMREKARLAGYEEIRTPVFEHTELFTRSAGASSDVVRKEMYTFLDKGGRSITLKPETTAGAVRAFIESGLYAQALPVKLYYLYAPHFRYEAPQSGRLREHHQFGMECFGAKEASADAELILTAMDVLTGVGLQGVALRINSIGCPKCRPAYQEKLRAYLNERRDKLCKDCQERIDINPLRVLDCKNPECQAEIADAPRMIDSLCDECHDHFEELKRYLTAADVSYVVDTGIVRGLDYYTKTVFELTAETPSGTMTACGGGRYDRLVEELGGPDIPAVGFGMVGALQGFDSFTFAVCVVLATIVMYDATGVRRETGTQATVINQILKDVLINGKRISDEELKELVGHTPFEVLGGFMIGLTTALIYLWLLLG